MGNRMRKSSYSEREAARSRINHLRERATELEIQINEDLFSGHGSLLPHWSAVTTVS